MLARLKQMLIKEFIQVFRDKRTRFVLIGPPIIQMLIFGYAATYEIRHVPTVVLDLDHSQESRELISRFTSSPYLNVQRQLTTRREIEALIERGETTVAIKIDPGFAQQLRSGQSAPLQVIVDATNSNTALIASGYVNQIVLGFAKQYQTDRIGRISPQMIEKMPSIELAQRPWYNPELRSRWFFIPGIIGSLTLVLVVNLTAFAVVREREIGTLEQIMVTPIRPAEFILGKTLPFFLIGLFDVSLIGVVGTLWFQVPFRGHLIVLLTGAVLFLICMLGVGLLISTISATQQQAMVSAFFFIMPARVHPDESGSGVKVAPGTVIVREVLDATGHTAKLTIMAKGPPGFDPTLGDWWFGVTDPAGHPLADNGNPLIGRLTQCHDCHLERAHDDFLFGVPSGG